MAEYGKFHVANCWILGRQNLVGIEIATFGEGKAVIGLEGGAISTVNQINTLEVEKVRRRSLSSAKLSVSQGSS